MICRVLVVLVCLVSVLACRPKPTLPVDRLPALLEEGRYAEALEEVQGRLSAGDAPGTLRDLEIALLSREGRTPEAMDAYLERLDQGRPHDAALLEAVVLSSYPPQVRMDPSPFAGDKARPTYGEASASAVTTLMSPELKGQVPRMRLGDLVGMHAVPGRDASLDALGEFVEQRTQPIVRMMAMAALTRVRTPAAVERLEAIAGKFQSSSIMMRNMLDALQSMPEADPALAGELLGHETERVRARAAGVLAHSTHADAGSILAASDTVEARAALTARGEGTEETRAALEAYLATLDTPLLKARFLDILREVEGRELEEIVCTLALDPDPGVATNAAHVLGRSGGPAAPGCLVEAAGSQDEGIRLTALKQLLKIPAPDHVARLQALVRSAASSGDGVSAALGLVALARAGAADVEPFIEGYVESDLPQVRSAAAVALFHLGRDDMAAVLEEAFEEQKGPWSLNDHHEWTLLAGNPDERSLPLVVRAVKEGNPSLREKCLGAIIDARHPESVFLLEHVQLGRYADTSLEYRSPGSGKVVGLVIEILRTMEREDDADGRRALLERMLADEDIYLRAVALRFLALVDGEWAVHSAEEILRTAEDPWLRLEATRALAIIEATRLVEKGGKE